MRVGHDDQDAGAQVVGRAGPDVEQEDTRCRPRQVLHAEVRREKKEERERESNAGGDRVSPAQHKECRDERRNSESDESPGSDQQVDQPRVVQVAREIDDSPSPIRRVNALVVENLSLETGPFAQDDGSPQGSRTARNPTIDETSRDRSRNSPAAIIGSATTGTSLIDIAMAAEAPAQKVRSSTRRYALRRMNITNTGSVLPWKPEITNSIGLTASTTGRCLSDASAESREIENEQRAQYVGDARRDSYQEAGGSSM
jgi:hypothetical protein